MGRVTPARELALQVLTEVREGRFAEHALSSALDSSPKLTAEDRALATELVYGSLRWRRRLDQVVEKCSSRPVSKIQRKVLDILRIALYQIVMLDRVPDHAAVDQAVTQAKVIMGRPGASFVNAVLRRCLRERDRWDTAPSPEPASLARYYSHPDWVVKRWIRELGPDKTSKILQFNNSRPGIIVRANRVKVSRSELAQLWKDNGVSSREVPHLPDALLLTSSRVPITKLPGFQEGLFVVQDAASQLIAPLLRAEPGHRALDTCAAPGGKTSHLAALAGNRVEVTAVDADQGRLDETRLNLKRLGVAYVRLKQGDSASPGFVEGLGAFDRVLVDAPCANLGVLRHNPEAKYRTSAKDMPRYAELQLSLLVAAARAVKPSGVLVYSVCSVTREETLDVVARFMELCPDMAPLRVEPSEVGGLPVVGEQGFVSTFPPPETLPMDGFFAARFERSSDTA